MVRTFHMEYGPEPADESDLGAGPRFHNTKESAVGFCNAGLGPADQEAVKTLQLDVISTLREASTQVLQGKGGAASLLWFGDNSDAWMLTLGQKLNTMASLINTKDIAVSFSKLNGRCSGEFAAAPMPAQGWNDFATQANIMTKAQGQNFRIILNLEWNKAPLYRPGKTPADSKFQTIVHECTHLFLDTDDDAYGVDTCQMTASNSPTVAKKTADGWGYFVEGFRG